jgi:DNA-binding NarL/FixJ family response regulator
LAGPTGDSVQQGLSADDRLTVLVVDDHDVVRWGFRELLAKQSWVERFFCAKDRAEAVALAACYKPDVALVDLFLGDDSGTDVCGAIRRESRFTRVLLISGAGRISSHAAKTAGAAGFVSKEWSGEDIVMAVRVVGTGMTVFAPPDEQASVWLSDREREVLRLVAAGATNRDIAKQLYLSPHTVKQHTRAVYKKLNVRNRAEAVHRAERMGLID